MKRLLSLIHYEKYMYWFRNMDDSYVINDIFWTHPNLVKLLNMFHGVDFLLYIQNKQVLSSPKMKLFLYLVTGRCWLLTIDCTYKTNRFQLPLLEIVSVTPTKLTFLVVFAYLEHEKEENFPWSLEKLKELFTSDKLLPKVVVIYWELVLINVIEIVFSSSIYLLCVFYIGKNVSMKCKV